MNNLETTLTPQTSLHQQLEKLGHFIGNTPLYPIEHVNPQPNVQIYAKLEWQQFGGSVKARAAYRIISDAIKQRKLNRGQHLLDASSGNTGIAYAHIGASLGIPITLCLPENASKERKRILKALGVDIRLTPKGGGTDEAQQIAKEIYQNNPAKYFYADQYGNKSNWEAHYDTTGPEIWQQTEGKITHFITGLGTTGTFTGTSRRLRSLNPDIRLISVQPDLAMHGLEGWKHMETARIPTIYDENIADENRTISTARSHEMLEQTLKKEGLLLSPSAAANLASAVQLAGELETGTIVTVFPDNSSRYNEIIDKIIEI